MSPTPLARTLLKQLHRRMLCLLDREYVGYPWLKDATATKADFLIRVRSNMDLPVLKRLKDDSYLSHILPSMADRKAGARPIRVRVIEYTLAGKEEVYRLITTLMDPQETPAAEVAALYHERWEVETTLREVKAELRGGSLKTFQSRTPALVRQELYGFLLAHYLVRRALWESATQAQVDPDVLSFKHAVQVLTRRIPKSWAGSPGACWPSGIRRVWQKSWRNASPPAEGPACLAASGGTQNIRFGTMARPVRDDRTIPSPYSLLRPNRPHGRGDRPREFATCKHGRR